MTYPENLYAYVAKSNNITIDDAKHILERSEAFMDILTHQYGNNLDMICKKMREYQKLLIEQAKKQAKK